MRTYCTFYAVEICITNNTNKTYQILCGKKYAVVHTTDSYALICHAENTLHTQSTVNAKATVSSLYPIGCQADPIAAHHLSSKEKVMPSVSFPSGLAKVSHSSWQKSVHGMSAGCRPHGSHPDPKITSTAKTWTFSSKYTDTLSRNQCPWVSPTSAIKDKTQ